MMLTIARDAASEQSAGSRPRDGASGREEDDLGRGIQQPAPEGRPGGPSEGEKK